ncbi:MAG: ATP-binding protein [Candidatus Omnitrophota bacterium]
MWLEPIIVIDLGLKTCVTLILMFRYFELKTKVQLLWMFGWLLFSGYVLCELIGVVSGNLFIYFMALVLSSVIFLPFLFTMAEINKLPLNFKRAIVFVFGIFVLLGGYAGLYIKGNFFLAALLSSLINGSGFIICGGLYFKKMREKKDVATEIIFYSFIIIGIHNYSYPFLRINIQSAQLWFLLCSLLTLIFAAGLIFKGHNDILEKISSKTKKLKEMQVKLVQTERIATIGQMAAVISHELRNPLAGIKTAAYFLERKLGNKRREFKKAISDLELEMKYAENIITNVLTFARPKVPIFVLTDINKIIEDVLVSAQRQNLLNKIKVDKHLTLNLPEILVDVNQIKQAFMNLIINAVQAMHDGGQLIINSKKEGNNVKVDISDTGHGISPESLDKLFNPFFTTKSKGTGLGLVIIKEIVESNGGYVDVTSRLGEGTTFILNFPKN